MLLLATDLMVSEIGKCEFSAPLSEKGKRDVWWSLKTGGEGFLFFI